MDELNILILIIIIIFGFIGIMFIGSFVFFLTAQDIDTLCFDGFGHPITEGGLICTSQCDGFLSVIYNGNSCKFKINNKGGTP